MNQPNVMTALILSGACLFLFFYHVRTRRFDHSDRRQVRNWQFYGWIDAYLKLSTFGISLATLHVESSWLLVVHQNWPVRWIGLIIAGFGLCLFLAAMKTLDDQYTPAHIARTPRHLVVTGPYRFIRHPVYAANLAIMAGMFLLSGSLWIVANLIVLIMFYVPTILHEESTIRRTFPEFDSYTRRTGRIFPRITPCREAPPETRDANQ